MEIACAPYDMMALDLVGPYQVLSMLPGARVSLVASTAGPKRTDSGMTIGAEVATSAAPRSDIVVVPGTGRPQSPLGDQTLIAWLADVHRTTQ
jgi:putative intracellular protease/amidase